MLSARNVAAASADPPPRPAPTGIFFSRIMVIGLQTPPLARNASRAAITKFSRFFLSSQSQKFLLIELCYLLAHFQYVANIANLLVNH